MLGGIEGVMNLASASGEDLGTVSDIVTDSMTAFGIEASKAGEFADVLATTSANANTNVAMLGESFKYAAPVAGALGYSVEDTSLALGLMANAGIKASNSGTALRAIMTRIVKPTKESQEAIEKLGLQTKNADGTMRPLGDVLVDMRKKFANLTDEEKANTSAKMAGQEAMAGLLAIVNASDKDFDKLSGAITNSSGKSKEMADIMQDNLGGQLTQLKSAIEGVAIQFGEILIPILKDLVEKYVKPLIDRFSKLSPEMKKIILIGGGIVAVLGPLIAMVGAVASGVSALIPIIGAISLPLIGWVVGIVAVITALVLLWRNNEDFRNKVMEIWEGIKTFFAKVFEKIKTTAITIWNSLKEFWATNGDEILAKIKEVWDSVYTFLKTTFDAIVAIANWLWDTYMIVWNLFGEDILTEAKRIFNLISGVISGTFDTLKGILKIFIGIFTADWDTFWEGIKDTASGIIKIVKSLVGGLIAKIEGAINIFKKAKGLFSSADKKGEEAIKDAMTPEEKRETADKAKGAIGGSLNPMNSLNQKPKKISFFANGGIVDRPTLAMIGEGGESEAVIPLSKLGNIGGKTNILITGNNINDSMDLDIIANRIARELTLAGVN